ncbi:MAG: alanine/glycine:cation symporter family protein [Alphaproteobacteria bacterium]
MNALQSFLSQASSFVWGPFLLIPLLLGTGLFLSVLLKFMPLFRIGKGFVMAFEGRKEGQAAGEITPFQALTTALSATVGTGNIAGVATAIFLGGPGAVFWMWVTALLGMATKYSEAVLAVKYREVDASGRYLGGPMYYIRNGLGPRFAWLGAAFALFAMIAAFGLGNMVQANSVAAAFDANFGVPHMVTGAVLALVTFAVIIGGLRRIAHVAEILVPAMAVFYVGGALLVLLLNAPQVPAAVSLIVTDAFTGTAAAGGFAGAAVWAAMRFGVARGIFSNESGLGSAAIAHAAAQTNNPVRQGTIAMMGTFIDTIIVCTMTALVILTVEIPTEVDGATVMVPAWTSGLTGAQLSTAAFGAGLPGAQWVISIGLIIFAFTTVMGWSVYGERSAEYLFGPSAILPYRLVWIAALFVGAVVQLDLVWTFSDVMNGLMAIPNLIALILLSGTVATITREALAKEKLTAVPGKP